jgi:hypothetical protein
MNGKHVATALAAALLTAAVPATAGAAQQAKPAKTAKPLGKVKRDGATGTLRVRYSCKSGSTLWISLKQTKSGKKDPALKKEGSSKAAHTWVQSHRNPIKCDGQKHTAKFSVDKVEPGSKGKLVKGKAWLQFCVTEGESLTVSVARWVGVK